MGDEGADLGRPKGKASLSRDRALDGRDATDLLLAARALASQLRYYGRNPDTADGNWNDYFPQPAEHESEAAFRARLAALAENADGSLPPHLALLIAFLRVARHPRALLDDFTRQHLNFQFQTVLGFEAQPPRGWFSAEYGLEH